MIRNIVLFSVMNYELFGPSLTKWALTNAGEIGSIPESKKSRERFKSAAPVTRLDRLVIDLIPGEVLESIPQPERETSVRRIIHLVLADNMELRDELAAAAEPDLELSARVQSAIRAAAAKAEKEQKS